MIFKTILSFELAILAVFVFFLACYVVSAYIKDWWWRRHPVPPMTREELEAAKKDRSSIYYLDEHRTKT